MVEIIAKVAVGALQSHRSPSTASERENERERERANERQRLPAALSYWPRSVEISTLL